MGGSDVLPHHASGNGHVPRPGAIPLRLPSSVSDQEIRYPRHLFRFRLCCERNGRSLLPWKGEKAARFWERAFHEDATRPHSLFGLPKISIEEYQRMLNSRLDEIKGQKLQAELVSFSPWHAYKNHDGTYRWTQEARVIISDERHLSYPMWVYTNLYRQGGMYYLIIVQGSHTTAEKIGKNLLYAFYGLERSGT